MIRAFVMRIHICFTKLRLRRHRRLARFGYDGKVCVPRQRGWVLLQLQLTVSKNHRRSPQGAALSEFAPGLFLLLMFGLFPVIDAIFIGVDYASSRYLLELQLREAQKLPRSKCIEANGSVMKNIPEQWRKSLLGGMSNPDELITTKVTYTPVPWQPVGSNQTINFWFVTIDTKVSFKPLLSIPLFNGVPGLGSPITFSITDRRPVENNRFLNE